MIWRIFWGLMYALALVVIGFNILRDFEFDNNDLTLWVAWVCLVVCGHLAFGKHPKDN